MGQITYLNTDKSGLFKNAQREKLLVVETEAVEAFLSPDVVIMLLVRLT